MNIKFNILFVSALPLELKIIKEKIKSLGLKDFNFDFFLSGVGSYNTIYNLKDYFVKNNKPDFLVNIGVCGISNKSIFNDFFQVYRIKNSSNNRELLPPIYLKLFSLKSILCSEKVITNKEEMFDENFVDMESFGIDYISTKEKIPFIILKKPLDEVGTQSKSINLEEIKNNLENLDYNNLILSIGEWLNQNQKKSSKSLENLDFYKDYFRFTFSEFEQFKKQYNKISAYKLDFEEIFQENKSLNKDKFLEFLSKI